MTFLLVMLVAWYYWHLNIPAWLWIFACLYTLLEAYFNGRKHERES